MSLPRIHCVFFTDATLPVFLREESGRALAGDLLVELSSAPTLSYALGLDTPAGHPGVAGVLGGLSAADLAVTSPQLPAPIILAAGRSTGLAALRSAIAALRTRQATHRAITLLVPVSDAAALGAALAVAEKFAVAWNVAAFPQAELLDFARWLAAEGLLHGGNFAGLHAYTPELLDGTAAAHVQQLAPLLGTLADAAPGSGRTVVVPSN
jgi:hypothetical protein